MVFKRLLAKQKDLLKHKWKCLNFLPEKICCALFKHYSSSNVCTEVSIANSYTKNVNLETFTLNFLVQNLVLLIGKVIKLHREQNIFFRKDIYALDRNYSSSSVCNEVGIMTKRANP